MEFQLSENKVFVIRAWAVHFYTSLGLIAAFLALTAVVAQNAHLVFIFLGFALFIDATDGTLARSWKVKQWAAEFDGRKLDDITDYINYALIPLFFMYQFELVKGWGLLALGFALIAAAYGFCQNSAKTDDGYFTGFPNFWNIVVFYLYLLKVDSTLSAIIIVICSLLIWVPIKYLSFSTKPLRNVSRVLTVLYGVVLLAIMISFNDPPKIILWGSLIFPAYYILASIYLTLTPKHHKVTPDAG